ncbi:hypothetical protein Pmani_036217 [Petrolisthes manimaculis]|uniref:Uncharacterized protein n=1 Tax=Petrolisthes manimaculis TaxID=1843537 RepID=A0AAE1ND35_9EUCA|nr:hypothetical protein Pmani_039299 [Petrolisthes manimaculis]KAK4290919.1 hypothetical protein Pmani_036217 [Petrolisthes manimaculis]
MGVKEGSSGQQDGQQSQQGMWKRGTSPVPSASAATTGAASECSRENRDELFLYLCAWRGESGSGVSVVTCSLPRVCHHSCVVSSTLDGCYILYHRRVSCRQKWVEAERRAAGHGVAPALCRGHGRGRCHPAAAEWRHVNITLLSTRCVSSAGQGGTFALSPRH